ncbi:MAG: helix-turn-helix domain-containing protein [Pseudomonadota bacterium]
MRSISRERDTEQELISAPMLFAAYRSARALGARKPVLLEALQLDEPELRGPLGRYSLRHFSTVCHATARELGGVCRTAEMGRLMVPTGFSDEGYSAGFRKSWSAVLEAMLKSTDLDSPEPCFHLVRLATGDRLYWEHPDPASEDLVRTLFSMITHWFAALSGAGPSLVRTLNFRQSEDRCRGYAASIGKSAGAGCSFNQITSFIEFFPGALDGLNPNHNPDILVTETRQRTRRMSRNPEKRKHANLCYDYLRPLLDKSGLGLTSAAQSFGIAERTLRRRLVSEGTSFRDILEQVRQDCCHLYFLEGRHLLTGISARLGYSELSAFTRAYSGWFGRPPSYDARSPERLGTVRLLSSWSMRKLSRSRWMVRSS